MAVSVEMTLVAAVTASFCPTLTLASSSDSSPRFSSYYPPASYHPTHAYHHPFAPLSVPHTLAHCPTHNPAHDPSPACNPRRAHLPSLARCPAVPPAICLHPVCTYPLVELPRLSLSAVHRPSPLPPVPLLPIFELFVSLLYAAVQERGLFETDGTGLLQPQRCDSLTPLSASNECGR